MNARLQVEHPVTEIVYGIDLVQWQLRIANGERLTFAQTDVRPRGWAIEARLYAEDPANDLLPSTGTIAHWSPPEGPGVRVDGGIGNGSEISHYYDPMLAKLIASGSDRAGAIARLQRILEECTVAGVRTNLPLLLWIARDDAFRAGETTTAFLDERLDESLFSKRVPPDAAVLLCAAALLLDGGAPWRTAEVGIPLRLRHDRRVTELTADATDRPGVWRISGDQAGELHARRRGPIVQARFEERSLAGAVTYGDDRFGMPVSVQCDGDTWSFHLAPAPSLHSTGGGQSAATGANVVAPMPGKIVKVAVSENDVVEEHALLVVLEAMKMEHRIEASASARVKSVLVKEGEIVAAGTPLVILSPSTSLETGVVEP
jgi:acetyl/propionyl-CoA carboxylase alpha subunit